MIFGYDFKDKVLWKSSENGCLYTSETLLKLWPFGNSLIGGVSFESAAYVARYMLKKQKGPDSWLKYAQLNYVTGEILFERSKEFFHTSRRPGIGASWFTKFYPEVFPCDQIVVDGRPMRPPKYYDSAYELVDPYLSDLVKERRVLSRKNVKVASENTWDRLRSRELCKLASIKQLTRSVE